MDIISVGLAADHGGYALKEFIKSELEKEGFDVVDFGNNVLNQEDDYTDYVIPMGRAVARGEIGRGIAFCGSGVGACIAINKLIGIRACLIQDTYSARQGVEDDNMNIICLGGRITGHELAWELTRSFLSSRFSGAERHKRRLAKIIELELKPG